MSLQELRDDKIFTLMNNKRYFKYFGNMELQLCYTRLRKNRAFNKSHL